MTVKISLKGKNFEEKTEVPPKNRRNLETLDFFHYLTHIAWKSIKFHFKICRQFSRHDFLCVSQRTHKCHFYEKKVFFLTKITKYDLKYYWRHGTIKRKNELEIKSFQAKKKFFVIDQKLSNLRLLKVGIFFKKSNFPLKTHLYLKIFNIFGTLTHIARKSIKFEASYRCVCLREVFRYICLKVL